MEAYKCDICGKYCDYVHSLYGTFNIYPNDYVKRGYKKIKKLMPINHLCSECYHDLERYIKDKYFEHMDKNSK